MENTETKKPAFEGYMKTNKEKAKQMLIDRYTLDVNEVLVEINIVMNEEEAVPNYVVSITNISEHTKIILEKIREEFITKINIEDLEAKEENRMEDIQKKFRREIKEIVKKYFPRSNEKTKNMLVNYLIQENIGLGKIDILLHDEHLEEIVINNHDEPVWVYHRQHGWLKTNIIIFSESKIRHYATIIGRNIGKEITNLNPLMDAHLLSGDRVNATLSPISTKGNTLTIRKFSTEPWTITKFLKFNTISYDAAALIWLAVQNELSILITGGTGSGKTSMLNVISNFFPPNQRIVSMEDTRELTLAENLHWVPLETRLPNPEGKGEIAMLDLLVNSLRMRPDRIVVGEIRRRKEAEVLMEAMHTGHSVCATLHANNAEETVTRLTNPPIDLPKPMLSAVSLIVVQSRNRRTGKRRTLQVAEVLPNGDPRTLLQFNVTDDKIHKINSSKTVVDRLKLYSGMTDNEIENDINEKITVLKWMVKNNIENVHNIGALIAKYYSGKLNIEKIKKEVEE